MKKKKKIKVSIIGGGPSNLLTAYMLSKHKAFDITIYEQSKRLGRKFLVAGNGGFNLSHDGDLNEFRSKYRAKGRLDDAIELFSNQSTKEWLKEIGIETYYGSSGRLFPIKRIKPTEVLSSLLGSLEENGVKIRIKHKLVDISIDSISLIFNEKRVKVESDYYVYGLGGKSWSKTGSDGNWCKMFKEKGIVIDEFMADNVGVNINWDGAFINTYDRIPLKNISIINNGVTQVGEALITEYGLEGNAIYPLSGNIIRELHISNESNIKIDFKPMWTVAKLMDNLRKSSGNTSKKLRSIGIPSVVIQLIKSKLDKEEWIDIQLITQHLKAFQLDVVGYQDIDIAISSQGGISLDQIDKSFQLLNFPNHYCNGEMLNWSAPTGGYLLQGCFSIGNQIALNIISKES